MLFAFYVCTKTGDCIAMAPNTHGAEQGTACASCAIGKSQEANAFITGAAMTACAYLAIFDPSMTVGMLVGDMACICLRKLAPHLDDDQRKAAFTVSRAVHVGAMQVAFHGIAGLSIPRIMIALAGFGWLFGNDMMLSRLGPDFPHLNLARDALLTAKYTLITNAAPYRNWAAHIRSELIERVTKLIKRRNQ
jgi:hypothetical protein